MQPDLLVPVGQFGVFVVVIGVMFRLFYLDRRDIKALKSRERRCQRNFDILVRACRDGGLEIPAIVWATGDDDDG